jgi:hypothetical protein
MAIHSMGNLTQSSKKCQAQLRGCAGSTGGAIKCVRVLVLVKQASRELYQLVHPHAVVPVKLGREGPFPRYSAWHLGTFLSLHRHFCPGLSGAFIPGGRYPDFSLRGSYHPGKCGAGAGNRRPNGEFCPPPGSYQMDPDRLHALRKAGNLHPPCPSIPRILEEVNQLFFSLSRCILCRIKCLK